MPRLIGKPRALQMFLQAEMVEAGEALRVGLVDQIVEDPIVGALDFSRVINETRRSRAGRE